MRNTFQKSGGSLPLSSPVSPAELKAALSITTSALVVIRLHLFSLCSHFFLEHEESNTMHWAGGEAGACLFDGCRKIKGSLKYYA